MPTTLDALKAGGCQVAWTMDISGYNRIITDQAGATMLAAVNAAWSGTGKGNALPGLSFDGSVEQRVAPWNNEIEAPILQIQVTPDENDTLAKAMFKKKADQKTRLTADLSATLGSGTLQVKSTTGFASSGTLHIGKLAVEYSSKTATSFSFPAYGVGTLAPFGNGLKNFAFSLPAPISPQKVFTEPKRAPVVTQEDSGDAPNTWIGREVALYCHRVVDGVLDEHPRLGGDTDAFLYFAGYITDYQDSSTGQTIIEVTDLRARLERPLFRRQYRAKVKEGLWLRTGDEFRFAQTDNVISDPLTVVASGASGVNQLNEGYYTVPEFTGLLNKFIEGEVAATRLTAGWFAQISTAGTGSIRFSFGNRNLTGNIGVIFTAPTPSHLEFLGFELSGEGFERFSAVGGYGHGNVVSGEHAPFKQKAFQARKGDLAGAGQSNAIVETEEVEGVWINQTDEWPAPFNNWAPTSGDFGFISIGKMSAFAKHTSDTKFEHLAFGRATSDIFPDGKDDWDIGVRMDEDTELEVTQILFFGGKFSDVMHRLFASVDGAGTNGPYDTYEFGGAGIPEELLGDEFHRSLQALEELGSGDSMLILLDKPVPITKIVRSELALRMGFIVFKEGTYRINTLPMPNATTAEHTLNETNKGVPPDTRTPDRTSTRVMDEWIRNVIEVKFNKTRSGQFLDSITALDEHSITHFGEARKTTIAAGNYYSAAIGSGHSIQDAAASLISRIAPRFGVPVKVWRRSINGSLLHMAPGDTCVFDDDYARSPLTGARGVSARAGVVIRVEWDWGHASGSGMSGEVDILYTDEDRVFPMAPAAEIVEGSGGWDGGTKTLTCEPHAYSTRISVSQGAIRYPLTRGVTAEALGVSVGPTNLWRFRNAAGSDDALDLIIASGDDLTATGLTQGVTHPVLGTVARFSEDSAHHFTSAAVAAPGSGSYAVIIHGDFTIPDDDTGNYAIFFSGGGDEFWVRFRTATVLGHVDDGTNSTLLSAVHGNAAGVGTIALVWDTTANEARLLSTFGWGDTNTGLTTIGDVSPTSFRFGHTSDSCGMDLAWACTFTGAAAEAITESTLTSLETWMGYTNPDAEEFSDGDVVQIIEVDPADPTTGVQFSDTVNGEPVGNDIVLTNGFGAGGRPAHDTSKVYRITPDLYSLVNTDQRLVTYMADDGDGEIEGLIEPNQYDHDLLVGHAAADATALFARYNDKASAEGQPAHPGLIDDAVRNANSLLNYRTATHVPWVSPSANGRGASYSADDFWFLEVFPVPVPTGYPVGRKRVLKVNVLGNLSVSSKSGTFRITSSPHPPTGGSKVSSSIKGVEFPYPNDSVEFTFSSTTFALGTLTDLRVNAGQGGVTWITVEGKQTTSSGGLVQMKHLHLYLGELE